MIALLASPYGAVFAGAFSLVAVTAGVTLGAVWDDLAAALRRRTTPKGAHRR